jgi:hypothetical protein
MHLLEMKRAHPYAKEEFSTSVRMATSNRSGSRSFWGISALRIATTSRSVLALAAALAIVASSVVLADSATAATKAASISGIVKGTKSGHSAAVAGATVELYGTLPYALATTHTTSKGTYTFAHLAAGKYKVRVDASNSPKATGWLERWYGGATRAGWAKTLTLKSKTKVTKGNVALLRGATISGTATNSTAAAAKGIVVTAVTLAGTPVGSATTNTAGAYSVNGLPAGTYQVRFGASSRYATQWSGNAASQTTAAPITVAAGAISLHHDAVLQRTGDISGSIANADGTLPASSLRIELLTPQGEVLKAEAFDGSTGFEFDSVAAGEYLVRFSDIEHKYLTRYYPDAATRASATPITVVAGQSTELEEATAIDNDEAGATAAIEGSITNDAGAAAEGVLVRAYTRDRVEVETAETDEQGQYRLGHLTPGDYTVVVIGGYNQEADRDYVDAWTGGSPTFSGAGFVTASDGETVTMPEVKQQYGSEIYGSVTAKGKKAAAGYVELYSTDGVYLENAEYQNGGYNFYDLLPGSYKVKAQPTAASTAAYGAAWSGGSSTFASAATVTLTSSEAVTAKTIALSASHSSLKGLVTAAVNGKPLDNVLVQVSELDPDGVWRDHQLQRVNNSDGTYSVLSLAAGQYRLSYTENATDLSGPRGQWYLGASTLDAATVITLESAAVTLKTVRLALSAQAGITSPVVTGDGAVGSQLTASVAITVPLSASVAYQWNRDGVPIVGATGSTYEVAADDTGQDITVTATATKSDYATSTRESLPIAVAEPAVG